MKFRLFCTLFVHAWRKAAPVAAVLVAVVLAAALPMSTHAAEVTGLYEARAIVSSRDDERERQQGFSAALREVLVKLTGRADTLQNPVVTQALGAPQSYVETWAYNSIIPDDPFAQPGQPEQIELQVTFFQAGIAQMLNDAGIALWPQNRPDTLVWIAFQDELGERMHASREQGSELLTALEETAATRGLPVLFPLLDFNDLRAVSVEQLWNFDVNSLRIASSRYQGESILALRVFRSLSGDVIAKAVYIFRDQVLELEALEEPLEPFLENTVNLVAEQLASYYAISLSAVGDPGAEVLMTVDGVGSAADYAGLLGYLNGLAVVSGVQVVGAQGPSLQLKLQTGGQSRQLVESIALDRRLVALGDVTRNGPQVLMHYRWSPQP